MHYYKRNIGDYYKKAGRLTMLQHGAYTQLIDSCYDREKFPTLDEAIEWVWAGTEEEVQAVKFVLQRFFKLEGDVYVQERIKDELENYKEIGKKNQQIALEREAKKRAEREKHAKESTKRAKKEHEACTDSEQVVHESAPNQEPLTTNQEPLTNNKVLMSDKSDAVEVILYLNQVVGGEFKTTTQSYISTINARLKEGYSVEDMKLVVDFKAKEWMNTNAAQYLRPGTLFIPKNFAGYLQGAKSQKGKRDINQVGTDFTVPEWLGERYKG